MTTDETKLAVATQATRPRSVQMTDQQPVAVINATDPTPLEVALDQTLPWPQSIAEEIALEQRRLGAFVRGPARTRKASEVSRVLALLDEIGKDDDK